MRLSARVFLGILLLAALALAFTLKQPESRHCYLYNPYALGYTCALPQIGNLRVLPLAGYCLRHPVASQN